MVDGKDDVIKHRQIESRSSVQWIVAELNTIFYHWLYRRGMLEFNIKVIQSLVSMPPRPQSIGGIERTFYVHVTQIFTT